MRLAAFGKLWANALGMLAIFVRWPIDGGCSWPYGQIKGERG